MRAGIIGLGDMGSGLALNLIKNGFETSGYDLDPVRMEAFKKLGGAEAASVTDVARNINLFKQIFGEQRVGHESGID